MDELDLVRLRATSDPYHLADKNKIENRKYSKGTHEERLAWVRHFTSLLREAENLYRRVEGKRDDYTLTVEERCKAIVQANELYAIQIDLRRKISYADPDLDLDMERLKAGEAVPPALFTGPRGGTYEWVSGRSGLYRKYL